MSFVCTSHGLQAGRARERLEVRVEAGLLEMLNDAGIEASGLFTWSMSLPSAATGKSSCWGFRGLAYSVRPIFVGGILRVRQRMPVLLFFFVGLNSPCRCDGCGRSASLSTRFDVADLAAPLPLSLNVSDIRYSALGTRSPELDMSCVRKWGVAFACLPST